MKCYSVGVRNHNEVYYLCHADVGGYYYLSQNQHISEPFSNAKAAIVAFIEFIISRKVYNGALNRMILFKEG